MLHALLSSSYKHIFTKKQPKQEPVEGGGYYSAQYLHTRHLPSLPSLRSKFGVRAALIAKAAIAIFNTHMTGSSHVIWLEYLAGREWPFIDEPLARLLPDPWAIAGPTLSTTVDAVRVDRDKKAGQMLRRLGSQQRELNRYQHLPQNFPKSLSLRDRFVWL